MSWSRSSGSTSWRFAYYREDTVGTMREEGLNDYLVLLSIYQTCLYKGVPLKSKLRMIQVVTGK